MSVPICPCYSISQKFTHNCSIYISLIVPNQVSVKHISNKFDLEKMFYLKIENQDKYLNDDFIEIICLYGQVGNISKPQLFQ